MTAVNVFRSATEVHICTDGLCLLPNRTCLVSKVHVASHMPLVLATRGLAAAPWMFGAMLSQAFAGFDELVDGLADQFPNMHTRFLRCVPDSGIPAFCEMQTPDTELYFAGWSAARQQCEAYFIRAGDERREYPHPFRLIPIDCLFGGPWLPMETWLSPDCDDNDDDGLEHDMIALMEAQRHKMPQFIGGFCQVTTLTQHSVTQRILRRWPEDGKRADQPQVPVS